MTAPPPGWRVWPGVKTKILPLAVLLALAGCGPDPVKDGAENGAPPVEDMVVNDGSRDLPGNVRPPEPTNQAAPTNTAASATPAAPIPAQYRGRWGMNANDCDPRQAAAAKGLITIGERTIRFYESTATVKEPRVAVAISYAALFVFTGEGQTWEKVETLTRSGDTLTRADADGTFTYTRCA